MQETTSAFSGNRPMLLWMYSLWVHFSVYTGLNSGMVILNIACLHWTILRTDFYLCCRHKSQGGFFLLTIFISNVCFQIRCRSVRLANPYFYNLQFAFPSATFERDLSRVYNWQFNIYPAEPKSQAAALMRHFSTQKPWEAAVWQLTVHFCIESTLRKLIQLCIIIIDNPSSHIFICEL